MKGYFREKNWIKYLLEHLRHRTSGAGLFQNQSSVPTQIVLFILDVISNARSPTK